VLSHHHCAVADLDLEDKGVGSPGKRHRLGGMGALPPPKTAARPAPASATADRATRVELEALEAELDVSRARTEPFWHFSKDPSPVTCSCQGYHNFTNSTCPLSCPNFPLRSDSG